MEGGAIFAAPFASTPDRLDFAWQFAAFSPGFRWLLAGFLLAVCWQFARRLLAVRCLLFPALLQKIRSHRILVQ